MELFVTVIVSGFDTCTAVSGRGFFVVAVFVSGEILFGGFRFW